MKIFIFFVLLLGVFLRFYNLNWGAPYYFHPDERNIAYLISSLDPTNLNFLLKGSFAYGTLVSNVVFLIKNLTIPSLSFFGFIDSFSQSIILLRITSSVSSVLTIVVVFLIGYKTLNRQQTLLATLLTTLSVGLIQAAHFGVYESVLTLLYSLLLLVSVMYFKTRKIFFILSSIIIVSLATAIKINSLIFLLAPVFLFGVHIYTRKIKKTKALFFLSLVAPLFVIFTIIASPYYLTSDFKNMFAYEAALLTGSLPVFYTGEFFNSVPFLFQFTHILPFLINPISTVLLLPSVIYVLYKGVKKKNLTYLSIVIFFLILFLPNTLLFAKWTRYLVPLLPFMYFIIAVGTVDFLDTLPKKLKVLKIEVIGIMVLISAGFAISYMSATFLKQDSRITASKWASQSIPRDAKILSEVYDLGITPFNAYFPNISLFNFYDLESNSDKKIELEEQLKNADYIILPGQRILRSRMINKDMFPQGYNFYSNLISGKLEFKKIYETPCDMFCRITYLGDPIFRFEETASVFDRPTVLIFKKGSNEKHEN